GGGGRGAAADNSPVVGGRLVRSASSGVTWGGGAWWTNTQLVTRLGLTDDQKAKIQRAFENHRPTLESSTALLDKEEAQLAKLLAADTIDRNAVLSQIDRVTQARSEMERINSVMTLEMRESLTRAQWTQLQQQPVWFSEGLSYTIRREAPPANGEGQRSGGGRGQRQ